MDTWWLLVATRREAGPSRRADPLFVVVVAAPSTRDRAGRPSRTPLNSLSTCRSGRTSATRSGKPASGTPCGTPGKSGPRRPSRLARKTRPDVHPGERSLCGPMEVNTSGLDTQAVQYLVRRGAKSGCAARSTMPGVTTTVSERGAGSSGSVVVACVRQRLAMRRLAGCHVMATTVVL
jgi:hypothetical protein